MAHLAQCTSVYWRTPGQLQLNDFTLSTLIIRMSLKRNLKLLAVSDIEILSACMVTHFLPMETFSSMTIWKMVRCGTSFMVKYAFCISFLFPLSSLVEFKCKFNLILQNTMSNWLKLPHFRLWTFLLWKCNRLVLNGYPRFSFYRILGLDERNCWIIIWLIIFMQIK